MNAIIGVDVGKQSQTKILKFTKEDWEKERLQLQDQIRIEDYFKKVIALHHEIDEVVIRLLKPLNHEPDGNTSKNHKPDGNTLGTPTEAWISASFDVEPADPNQPGFDFFYRPLRFDQCDIVGLGARCEFRTLIPHLSSPPPGLVGCASDVKDHVIRRGRLGTASNAVSCSQHPSATPPQAIIDHRARAVT